jgi:hypothetical protein
MPAAPSLIASGNRAVPSGVARPLDRSRRETGSPTHRAGRTPHDTAATGPNLGWALACAGLLLAAGILGLTDNGRSAKRRRHRLTGALHPLLHRR